MTGVDPSYGSTPLDFEELDALLPQVSGALGPAVSKLTVYELEQAYEVSVRAALVPRAAAGEFPLDELLSDRMLRDLHGRLYEEIWSWAGRFRTRELSIGIDPTHIAVELYATFGNLHHRWTHSSDWNARELALAAHAEAVRIHPFVDGNGRSTRLLADLVLLAAQDESEAPAVFDWDLDKSQYIAALRRFDASRDPRALADLIEITELDPD